MMSVGRFSRVRAGAPLIAIMITLIVIAIAIAAPVVACNGVLDNQAGHLAAPVIDGGASSASNDGSPTSPPPPMGGCPNDCLSSSCSNGLCLIASGVGDVRDVGVDGAYVYWSVVTNGHGAVRRAPRVGVGGGVPEDVFTSDDPVGAISVRGGVVAVVNGEGFAAHRIAVVDTKDLSANRPTYYLATPTFLTVGQDVSVSDDGSHVLWTTQTVKPGTAAQAFVSDNKGTEVVATYALRGARGFGVEIARDDVFLVDPDANRILGGSVSAPASYGLLLFTTALPFVPNPTFIGASEKAFCFSELTQRAIVCCDRPACGDHVTPITKSNAPVARLRVAWGDVLWIEEGGTRVNYCRLGEIPCAVGALTGPLAGGVVGLGADVKAACFAEVGKGQISCVGRP